MGKIDRCPNCGGEIIIKTKELWECTYHVDSNGYLVNAIDIIVQEVLQRQHICKECKCIIETTD